MANTMIMVITMLNFYAMDSIGITTISPGTDDLEHYSIQPASHNNFTHFGNEEDWIKIIDVFCVVANVDPDYCNALREINADTRITLHATDASEIFSNLKKIMVISFYNSEKTFYAPVGKAFHGTMPRIVWWALKNYTSSYPGVSIGHYCYISENVAIFLDGNHCYRRISSYPWFARYRQVYKDSKFSIKYRPIQRHWPDLQPCQKDSPVIIGNDVHIGSNVIIMPGVTVGDGAAIESYSVVRNNVEPYSIVMGNPAVKIGLRFESDVINELLNIKWWDWSDEKIDANIDIFMSEEEDVSQLIEKLKSAVDS